MKLYTIISDRKKWKNELDSELVKIVEYSESEVEEFKKSIEGYILKDEYRWVYENDYEEDSGSSTDYHEITPGKMLICNGKVVGVIFVTEHHEHAMSNCCHYDFDAVFFDKPNEAEGEWWQDYCRIYDYRLGNSTYDQDCDIYIIKKEEMPKGYSFDRLPIGNIQND